MKKILFQFVLLSNFLLTALISSAQTGSAGVGNSSSNKIWLDASYVTGITSGSKITSWPDRSGNGWNANQNSTTYRPTYIANEVNGNAVIRFDRTAVFQYLEMTSAGIGAVFSNSHSVFIVAKATTGALNNTGSHIQVLITTPSFNSTVAFSGSPTATGIYMHNYVGTGSDYISKITNYTQGTWRLMNRVMTENVGGTTLTGYVNGGLIGSVISPQQMKNYSNLIRLGTSNTSGTYAYPLNGDIAEIITYNGALNDAQRIIIENYLAAKYAFTISNDKYSHDGSYILDVQGIGTSDGSAANKHTHASNSKGLHLEEVNSTLDAADEFLLAGHATNNNATVNTDLPIGVSERWQRIWYLEKTGSLDAELSFDISDAGLSFPPNLSNDFQLYRLLYRSSTTGPFVAVSATPLLLNDDQLSFTLTNAQLLSGYYTLGYSQQLIWTGAQNEEWNNAANWNLNHVPSSDDLVLVNSCTICPALANSVNIAGFEVNGGKITLGNYTLDVDGFTFINEAEFQSVQGKIKSTDFAEIKNSNFRGAIVIEKIGGAANNCYGGNTFSTEIKFVNSSSSPWEVTNTANNIVVKLN